MKARKLDIIVLAITLLIVTIAPIATAYAGQWTALGGVSQFTAHDDGVWYQEAFPYKLNLTSPSLGLRYDGDGWTAGYMHLGRVTSNAKAVALDGRVEGDGGYNSSTKACNGPCWPLSTWHGNGEVQGLFFGLTKPVNPEWTIEGGIYLYRPTWEMNIPDWIGCRDCKPAPLSVKHHAFWQPGPYVGIRWQLPSNPLSLNFSIWQTATRGDEWCSLYTGATYNVSLGYSFK
jgi:hypothetical protein